MTLKPVSKHKWNEVERLLEINKVCNCFVTSGKANRDIYRAIIEALFPPGSGLPGPVLSREDIYAAVHTIKPKYKDVFRRVRELQGEEGLYGLVKCKTKYQIQSLSIEKRRNPRQPITKAAARKIALGQGSRCLMCGTAIVINGGSVHVDHKVPRNRGGDYDDNNLQVLCAACNVMKSSQCSGCNLPCQTCAWAFPEKYRFPRIRQDLIVRLNEVAQSTNRSVDDIANESLDKILKRRGPS